MQISQTSCYFAAVQSLRLWRRSEQCSRCSASLSLRRPSTRDPNFASPPTITGRASVIDGDTITIHGTHIHLFGIDAPESRQSCNVGNQRWRCGHFAALALDDQIARRPVTCDPKDRDRYNRVVAVCHVGGVDLNAWMVSEGWAVAYRHYSTAYVPEEERARIAHRQIWRGPFVMPWEWRRGERLADAKGRNATGSGEEGARENSKAQGEPRECNIKGNINARGEHIYHVPGGRYYNATRIDLSRGERWFCSEAEARAAGWRRSLR